MALSRGGHRPRPSPGQALFSRRVVGWVAGDRLHRDLALAALRKALVMRPPPEGLIHHSDGGSQHCSVEYQAELRRQWHPHLHVGQGKLLRQRHGRDIQDHQVELVCRTVFYNRAQVGQAIARYIDGFYNPVRRHSALDYTSPAQFERTASR